MGFKASLVGAGCSPGQATSWNFPSTDRPTPSGPWACHKIHTIQEPQTFAEIGNEFEITQYELLNWNCFLDGKDGEIEPGTQICVDASLEGLTV